VLIEPYSCYAFLCLGSDGEIKLRRQNAAGVRAKYGSLNLQHGDVVGIRSGTAPIEVVLKLDGFGFCAYLFAFHYFEVRVD
jgi:hypothetical protein